MGDRLKELGKGKPFGGLYGDLKSFIGKFSAIQTVSSLATGAIMGLGRSFTEMLATGARMEQIKLSMEAFTGSAESAGAAMKRFTGIAAKTPFNVEQVANAGRIMMAFGLSADEATTATGKLAIMAAATNGDLNQMSRNLGQIQAQGQAYTRDLTQFAIQGIPIWQAMSDVTGQSVVALKQMASEGKISYGIVAAAINELTKEGSAYHSVAQRQQETWIGRINLMATAATNFAGKLVTALNKIDQAFGGPVANGMAAVATGLNLLGGALENIGNIAIKLKPLLVGLVTAMTVYNVIANWGTIATVLGNIIGPVWKLITGFKLMAAAAAAWKVIMSPAGLASVAAGIGAAAIVMATLGDGTEGAADAAGDMKTESDALAGSLNEVGVNAAQTVFSLKGLTGETRESMKNLKGQFEDLKPEYEAQKGRYEMVLKAAKNYYDGELQAAQNTLTELKTIRDDKIQMLTDEKNAETRKIDHAIQELQRYKQEEVTRHTDAIGHIDAEISKITEKYAAERGILQERTAEEKKLAQMKIDELRKEIQNHSTGTKDRLEAEVRYQQAVRAEALKTLQEKEKMETEGLKNKKKALQDSLKTTKENVDQEIREHKNRKDSVIKTYEEERDAVKELYKDPIRNAEAEIKAIKSARAEVLGQYKKMKDKEKGLIIRNGEEARSQIKKEAAALVQLEQQINSLKAKAATVRQGQGRAAGGPVAGGTTYTVNEVGREAFLSASGKLSMINAPAWGQWKAPSSGTVIPAHVTAGLDIPAGGINVGKKGLGAHTRNTSSSRTVNNSGSRDRMNNIDVSSPRQSRCQQMLIKVMKRRRF